MVLIIQKLELQFRRQLLRQKHGRHPRPHCELKEAFYWKSLKRIPACSSILRYVPGAKSFRSAGIVTCLVPDSFTRRIWDPRWRTGRNGSTGYFLSIEMALEDDMVPIDITSNDSIISKAKPDVKGVACEFL